MSKSTLDRYRRSNHLDNEEAITIVKTLTYLRYLHSDAMEDEQYKNTFYPTDVKIKNKGGLYLVRKEMFPFFQSLLGRIMQYFKHNPIQRCDNEKFQIFISDMGSANENTNETWRLFIIGLTELHITDAVPEVSIETFGTIFRNLFSKSLHVFMNQERKRVERERISFKDKNSLRTYLGSMDLMNEYKKSKL